MKLLTLVLFFSLIFAFSSPSAAAQHKAASSPAVRSVEVVLKEFYQWYIREVNGRSNNYPWKTTRGREMLKKYVTLRFIRAIDRNERLPEEADAFDADYFLLEQDTSGITGKNISVSKVTVRGATATALVGFERRDPGVQVTIIRGQACDSCDSQSLPVASNVLCKRSSVV